MKPGTMLKTQITNKHCEHLEKIDVADKNAKEAPQLVKNNEIVISELRHKNQALREKIKSEITEGAEAVVKWWSDDLSPCFIYILTLKGFV